VTAIRQAYQNTDRMFKEAYPLDCRLCGAVAVICLIIGKKLFCVNLGDARAILSRNGQALDLS
jgi:serine/threonine protein phosphatase PrpC